MAPTLQTIGMVSEFFDRNGRAVPTTSLKKGDVVYRKGHNILLAYVITSETPFVAQLSA